MAQQRRLTRKEKIAQSEAIKAGIITDPRHLIGLPEGTYTVTGDAAVAVHMNVAAHHTIRLKDQKRARS